MLLSLFLLLSTAVTNAQFELPVVPREVLEDSATRFASQPDPTPCDLACASIASRLPSSLFLGKAGNFEMWDSKQSDLTPACRVEPASSEEASFVLKTVTDASCHFAIKSGGHDRTPGSSNAAGGVTIDLVRLNQVTIAKDRKTVTLGAGLRWVDVYYALEKENLMVPGGRADDIGVGGLTLGGGLSFFANSRGWVCDNVVSYEIVLPNSSVETVTLSSRPDLYRSLRGAGASNFGIVTSFTMETFTPPNPAGLWRVLKLYSWDKVPELLKLHYKVGTESLDQDPDASAIYGFRYRSASDKWFASHILGHASHPNASTWPEVFQPYQGVEGMPNTTKVEIKPVSNTTVELGQDSPNGDRNIWATLTFRPSVELEQRLVDLHVEVANSVKDMPDFVALLHSQTVSRRAIEFMKKRGGNALGIVDGGETGPLEILATAWKWSRPSDDERSYEAHYRFWERAEAAAKEMGLWLPYKYINYAEATQDVFTGYGDKSLKELRRVQREVDPNGVFAKGGLGGGYFKLNEMPQEEQAAVQTKTRSKRTKRQAHQP